MVIAPPSVVAAAPLPGQQMSSLGWFRWSRRAAGGKVRVTRWVKLEWPRELAVALRPSPVLASLCPPPPPNPLLLPPPSWIISIRDYKRASNVSLVELEPEVESLNHQQEQIIYNVNIDVAGD